MRLAEDIGLLIRVPLFSDLSSDHLRLLAFSGQRMDLPTGRVLFRKSAEAASAYVVMGGEIAMTDTDRSEPRTLGRFGPGSLLGESALFVETRHPATAVATVESHVLEIDRLVMRRMLNEYPDVAARLHARLFDRLASTVTEISHVRPRLDAVRYREHCHA